MDKKTVSQEKRKLRKNLAPDNKMTYDYQIHSNCSKFMNKYQSFGLYASFNDEVDTFALIKDLLLKNKLVALPKLEGKKMNFYQIHQLDNLELSSFGILEPSVNAIQLSKEKLDVLFIPLSAFNHDKHRIGYGGGYYDRYLEDYHGLKIGLAYSFQETDFSDFSQHDIACDYIITEKGIL